MCSSLFTRQFIWRIFAVLMQDFHSFSKIKALEHNPQPTPEHERPTHEVFCKQENELSHPHCLLGVLAIFTPRSTCWSLAAGLYCACT